jgi:hypothetical protein
MMPAGGVAAAALAREEQLPQANRRAKKMG